MKQKLLNISLTKDEDDDDLNDMNENSTEYKVRRAKHIIFGKYAELC